MIIDSKTVPYIRDEHDAAPLFHHGTVLCVSSTVFMDFAKHSQTRRDLEPVLVLFKKTKNKKMHSRPRSPPDGRIGSVAGGR